MIFSSLSGARMLPRLVPAPERFLYVLGDGGLNLLQATLLIEVEFYLWSLRKLFLLFLLSCTEAVCRTTCYSTTILLTKAHWTHCEEYIILEINLYLQKFWIFPWSTPSSVHYTFVEYLHLWSTEAQVIKTCWLPR